MASSSIAEKIACPAYLRIVAMGISALPLVIEQMKREGDDADYWGPALEAITGENPVPEDARGDSVRTAQAWIAWSETRAAAKMDFNFDQTHFPNLNQTTCRITSAPTRRYNCIAWAAESVANWWWPNAWGYWPPGVEREPTLGAFIDAFRQLGYEVCADGSLEEGYQKISLYVDGAGAPTHAARQLPDGAWTSKIGECEDIVHATVNDLSGPMYGAPVQFMRRPLRVAA